MTSRDNARLAKIRQLPCCECGRTPVDVAHSNYQEHGKGKGIKADDYYTIPFCRYCHCSYDQACMGMTYDEMKAWFLEKHEFIEKVLDEKPNEPLF